MKRLLFGAVALLAAMGGTAGAADRPHNIVLFVPDGLRARMVTPATAPTMASIRDQGVNFINSHSIFPTFTTANASAFATGHYLGDTGDFSNTIYVGYPAKTPGAATVTPFLEADITLGDIDEHFSGDYLDEKTFVAAARAQGYGTATIGKVGPVLIFDHTDRTGSPTIVVDDTTGAATGIPLSPEISAAMSAAGLPLTAPSREDNGKSDPGTKIDNRHQQDYFVAVTTKVVLPLLKSRKKPFALVYWSRDPDGTQHNQGDSPNELQPGINGPTSLAAIKNADNNLARIRQALDELGLAADTDIVVAADHGFSTISKASKTSSTIGVEYNKVPKGSLPPGFLAIDIASWLNLPITDSSTGKPVPAGQYPTSGNALIGNDAAHPAVVVAANGGSDLIYLGRRDRKLAAKIVNNLLDQDYVSGLFVDDRLGPIAGTLPLSAINLVGKARPPRPSIVVNFSSFTTGCAEPTTCAAEVADTPLKQGQGMHGSFSRADTMNFMAAIGPDFKAGFADPAPVSNADIGKTLAQLLGLKIVANGKLQGRVIVEALPKGEQPKVASATLRSSPGGAHRKVTILDQQLVGKTRYFDAAGFPGQTVGLTAPQ